MYQVRLLLPASSCLDAKALAAPYLQHLLLYVCQQCVDVCLRQ